MNQFDFDIKFMWCFCSFLILVQNLLKKFQRTLANITYQQESLDMGSSNLKLNLVILIHLQ